jgi:hypothetical protein
VDLTGCPDPAKPVDDTHFENPLILPSFGGRAGPNLALLLAKAYLGGPTDSRTAQLPDHWIDGILLRADKPALVAQALGEAGAQVVEDPQFWLSARRQVLDWRQISDEEIGYDPLVRARKRNIWLFVGGLVLAPFGAVLTPLLGWVSGGVSAVGFVRACQLTRALTERGWRRR